jgi:acetyl-CoA carboxylase biotin carboxyl carrier protein
MQLLEFVMKPKEIQKLIELVEKSGIGELEVSRWGKKVRIRKYSDNTLPTAQVPENIIVAQTPKSPAIEQAPTPPTPAEQAPEEPPVAEAEKSTNIYSPMVGTFYQSPAPDAEAYVKVGDTVSQGQVLCIIEAMKLMNEIEAEFPCRIIEILVENTQPVEYNQPLYKVEKI